MQAFVEMLDEEPFDQITVIDIATRCGINRNTFYYHFEDIYALVDATFKNETEKIIGAHRTFDSWQEAFLAATSFALDHRKAIYHLYDSINRERLEVYLYDVTYNNMKAYVIQQAEGLSVRDEDVRDLAVFYAVALEGLVLDWLHGGMKTDPEAYIENIGHLLDGSIRFALANASARDSGSDASSR